MSLPSFKRTHSNTSLIFLYLIVLVPVLTMCYFIYSDYLYRERAEITKNEQMARVLADNLDSYLENVKTTLVSLTTLGPVQNGERAKIEALLQGIKLGDKQVSLCWVSDVNGKIIAKYPNNRPDNQNKIAELYSNSVHVSEPRKGTLSGVEIISVSAPIMDDRGHIKGVIGASIPLENLRKKMLLKVGNTGFPILVSKKGTFLVHPKREEIAKKIKLNDPIFQVINKGGSGTLDIVAPFDGQRKFFSYVPLNQADWIVLVIQPLAEFQAQRVQLITRNGVIFILTFFLVLMGAYYLTLFRKREEDAKIFQAEKLSVIGQLAAGMAHEIRNPLTSIKGFAQLAASCGKGLTSEHLDIIISEVDRIESIVKETRLLAKPAPIEFKPIDVGQLFQEVYTLMNPQVQLKGATLTMQLENALPQIEGERNHLKQVLINLIKNSIEAVPEQRGRIDIKVARDKKRLAITVWDNGSGISPELITKLGNPFVSTKENGTGLGLMVTYRIIQNHGGKINVTSFPGGGTTFTIKLPTIS